MLLNQFFAKSKLQFSRFAPCQAQSAGYRTAAHQPHSLNHHSQVKRGLIFGAPEFAQRPDDSVGIRVKDALIPTARALREFRVIANSIEG